jgi:hypothetical protein
MLKNADPKIISQEAKSLIGPLSSVAAPEGNNDPMTPNINKTEDSGLNIHKPFIKLSHGPDWYSIA